MLPDMNNTGVYMFLPNSQGTRMHYSLLDNTYIEDKRDNYQLLYNTPLPLPMTSTPHGK
jgi:hypothetical protein